jgi:hypothetical protein
MGFSKVKDMKIFWKNGERAYLIIEDEANNHMIFKALDEKSKEFKEIFQIVKVS